MPETATLDFIAAGGNRHPSAADWAPGLLAFGAGNNVALWNPDDKTNRGVYALLKGHTDVVNAVKIYEYAGRRCLITGSSDNTVRIWQQLDDSHLPFTETQCLSNHAGAINTISILPLASLFASGSADGTVKIWQLADSQAKLVQSISLKPRFLPLATALVQLPSGHVVLAVAGTTTVVQLYARPSAEGAFELQATLSGHEGWVRSLDFLSPQASLGSDVLLASASQDKYVRLWRFKQGAEGQSQDAVNGSIEPVKKSLSNKAHQVGSTDNKYAVTFEALLVGHEDWIYSARWAPLTKSGAPATLLTASADNSLSMWSVEEASGLWVCNTRLGEISSQKGSTTATGSTGGFWIGLWQPDAAAVVSLGRTGSWRRWSHDAASDTWLQQLGVTGHTQEVQSLSWAPDGSYLLSTSLDQTTRLFAELKRDGQTSWHEVARPQIHGYDLNCIAAITPHQFVSGADEKLLRVFDKPKAINTLLSNLSNASTSPNDTDVSLPETANIPVLGLSNKAIEPTADPENPTEDVDTTTAPTLDIPTTHPPHEDTLARHTLFPEHDKLYGHGYEISTCASNPAGTLLATACKASSLSQAVIRLYTTHDWREVKPPLQAHSLTVTSLAFSGDGKWLLSVGRDRQWALWSQKGESWGLVKVEPKGHSRMILDCAWAPSSGERGDGHVFATAGRDKLVKLWQLHEAAGSADATLLTSLTAPTAVTAVAFSPHVHEDGKVRLSYGTDEGRIALASVPAANGAAEVQSTELERGVCPGKTVTALEWRPGAESRDSEMLAVASEDGSVRILGV